MDKIIEIDADGVLIDMDGSYAPYVEHIVPDYTEEKYVTDWGLPLLKEKYPKAHEIIFDLYKNPKFISDLPRYKGVVSSLKALSFFIKFLNEDYKMLIHTHMRGDECAKARREWLEKLKEESKADFQIKISKGMSKEKSQTKFCLIEDNVSHLKRSKAKIKILIRRNHNRKYGLEDINVIEDGKICNSFKEAAIYLETKISGVEINE